jgi:hypothetical protein
VHLLHWPGSSFRMTPFFQPMRVNRVAQWSTLNKSYSKLCMIRTILFVRMRSSTIQLNHVSNNDNKIRTQQATFRNFWFFGQIRPSLPHTRKKIV